MMANEKTGAGVHAVGQRGRRSLPPTLEDASHYGRYDSPGLVGGGSGRSSQEVDDDIEGARVTGVVVVLVGVRVLGGD